MALRVWTPGDTTLPRTIGSGPNLNWPKNTICTRKEKTRVFLFFETYKMVSILFNLENCCDGRDVVKRTYLKNELLWGRAIETGAHRRKRCGPGDSTSSNCGRWAWDCKPLNRRRHRTDKESQIGPTIPTSWAASPVRTDSSRKRRPRNHLDPAPKNHRPAHRTSSPPTAQSTIELWSQFRLHSIHQRPWDPNARDILLLFLFLFPSWVDCARCDGYDGKRDLIDVVDVEWSREARTEASEWRQRCWRTDEPLRCGLLPFPLHFHAHTRRSRWEHCPHCIATT